MSDEVLRQIVDVQRQTIDVLGERLDHVNARLDAQAARTVFQAQRASHFVRQLRTARLLHLLLLVCIVALEVQGCMLERHIALIERAAAAP